MKLKRVNTNKYKLGGENGMFKDYYFSPSKADDRILEDPQKHWDLYEEDSHIKINTGKIMDLAYDLKNDLKQINNK